MITSTANPRVKAARKLQRTKSRLQQHRFLIEGVRLVEEAWRSGVRPAEVFVDPELLAGNQRGENLLHTLAVAHVPCHACSPAVFATLADTQTPQGIAAVMPWPDLPPPQPQTLVLALDQVRDPGNAGTLLRTAAAAGVELVIFGPETVDPYNEKVVRAAMGAHFHLPLRVCTEWTDVDRLLGPELPRYLADAAGPVAYDQVDWRGPAALIVGGEAAGAGAAARAQAQLIAIPMHNRTESLNAGVAGAVILFEAARQRRNR